jgi:hypothetical protein
MQCIAYDIYIEIYVLLGCGFLGITSDFSVIIDG